jgi:hypothetical protein
MNELILKIKRIWWNYKASHTGLTLEKMEEMYKSAVDSQTNTEKEEKAK